MIIIDGREFIDREKSYKYLNDKFNFIYYVENLDALYDCFSFVNEDIELLNYKEIANNLGGYGHKFIKVFMDLALREDKNINFISF